MGAPADRILGRVCILLFLCAAAAAFPADSPLPKTKNSTDAPQSETAAPKTTIKSSSPSFPAQEAGVTVRTALLPEDKKQFLTYVLGQPTKSASLKTPSHLMNPDKYEFYTFDDDGQIVKKLMSVQEIQRILANSERGQSHEPHNPIEYYQIITVSPDVEPPPAVSRINPSEPLFSVHDVIASVQNVLKSEIDLKGGEGANFWQPPVGKKENVTRAPTTKAGTDKISATTAGIGAASELAAATTAQTVIALITENPLNNEKTTRINDDTEAEEQEAAIKVTTYRPKPYMNATHEKATTTSDEVTANKAAEKVDESEIKSVPLSLSDAHPGLVSNETFLETQASFIEQLPQIKLKIDSLETITRLPTTTVVDDETITPRPALPESAVNQMQIPMNQDLAESVSSVISQIASEISMGHLEGSVFSTESALLRTNAEDEDNLMKTTQVVNINDIYLTTEDPDTTAILVTNTTLYKTKPTQAPSSETHNNVIKPQNKPKPFQKVMEEEGKVSLSETEVPRDRTTTTATNESTTRSIPTKVTGDKIETKEGDILLDTADTEQMAETSEVPSLPSIPPEAVTVTAEHAKPLNRTETTTVAPANESNQTIPGVQVVMEGAIGKIPRPTETPDEIVKPTERLEMTTVNDKDEKDPAETRTADFFYQTTTLDQLENEFGTEQLQTTTVHGENSNSPSTQATKTGSPDDKMTSTEMTSTSMKPSTEMDFGIKTTETPQAETRTDPPRTDAINAAESKILPETISEITTHSPDQGTTRRQSPVVVTIVEGEDIPGALKQNIHYKPFFGKPQKPVYIKPTRVKTPTEVKPIKGNIGKPSNGKEPAEAKRPYENHFQTSPSALELEAAPAENLGLEATAIYLDKDIQQFADLCNELAFSLWSSVTHGGLSFVRSVVVSPFAVTSLLAMVFLGARGPTSGQMNDVLKLDDMVTFNPHLVFRNVTESLVISRNPGVSTAAFVRELYSDKSKGKLLDFYKERAQQFYDGHVEEVNFKTVSDTLRRQTNHLVKRQTWGKITDFLRGSNLQLRPPLAAFSANIFQTDCTKASTKDRDGEMYFVVLPASRLRRLVPVPAVVWRENFMAGYEPNLDATVVALNPSDSAVSTIFVLPGQQGLIAPGDNLARLERQLLGSTYRRGHWSRLMRSLLPRPGLELQIPRLSHRSVVNVTAPLQRMGLKDLFSAQRADLTGLNGLANDLHLSDMLQVNLFSTCGEDGIGSRHISEVYPATPLLRREKSSDGILSDSVENLFAVSDFEDPAISAMPLELRPRQARIPLSKPGARIPEPPRLRFDRPFLFFVRHNPTGLILHIGRFNPRLMT